VRRVHEGRVLVQLLAGTWGQCYHFVIFCVKKLA
jgi:hypothetical protein